MLPTTLTSQIQQIPIINYITRAQVCLLGLQILQFSHFRKNYTSITFFTNALNCRLTEIFSNHSFLVKKKHEHKCHLPEQVKKNFFQKFELQLKL